MNKFECRTKRADTAKRIQVQRGAPLDVVEPAESAKHSKVFAFAYNQPGRIYEGLRRAKNYLHSTNPVGDQAHLQLSPTIIKTRIKKGHDFEPWSFTLFYNSIKEIFILYNYIPVFRCCQLLL